MIVTRHQCEGRGPFILRKHESPPKHVRDAQNKKKVENQFNKGGKISKNEKKTFKNS